MKRAGRFAGIAALGGALLLSGTPDRAVAGHPFGTEDAGTQGTGAVEVEFNGERSRRSDGSRVDTLGTSVTMGILPKLDLAMAFSYDFARSADGGKERASGPIEATLKTALSEGDGGIPAVAVQGGISLPAVEGGQTSVPVTLIAEWAFDPIAVFANVGADIGTRLAGNREDPSTLRGSLAGILEIREAWFALSELLWEKQVAPTNPSSMEWLIGVKYEVTDTLAVDAGIRWGLTADSPHVTYLVGLTLGFRAR